MGIRGTEPCMSFRAAIIGKGIGWVNYEGSQNLFKKFDADASLFISFGSTSVPVGVIYCRV